MSTNSAHAWRSPVSLIRASKLGRVSTESAMQILSDPIPVSNANLSCIRRPGHWRGLVVPGRSTEWAEPGYDLPPRPAGPSQVFGQVPAVKDRPGAAEDEVLEPRRPRRQLGVAE